MAKRGRKPIPNRDEIIRAICAEIADGALVKDAAAKHGVTPGHLRVWVAESKELSALYARAREDQAHAWAEKALSVADGADELTQSREEAIEQVADKLVEDGDEQAARKVKALENALIQRDRLRVDTLKWMASKLAPKLYGERQAVELSGNLTLGLADRLQQAIQRLND